MGALAKAVVDETLGERGGRFADSPCLALQAGPDLGRDSD
jgi:hypothetical protein